MIRVLVLSLSLFFVAIFGQVFCAEEPSSRLCVEDCVVALEQHIPKALARLAAEYRGGFGYRLQNTLPAEKRALMEHVLADGSLFSVTRDVVMAIKNLKSNQKEIYHATREKQERWSITRPITSSVNGHIIMLAEDINDYGNYTNMAIVVADRIDRWTYWVERPVLPTQKKEFIIVPLSEYETLVSHKKTNFSWIIGGKPSEGWTRLVDGHPNGYDDIILLPNNRLAAARDGKIIFSSFDSSPKTLESAEECNVISYFFGPTAIITKLLVLPNQKLAVAGKIGAHAADTFLWIIDIAAKGFPLTFYLFEEEKKIGLESLSDGNIAVIKGSGKVEIAYADEQIGDMGRSRTRTLPIDKPAATIQGLSDGRLFVKFKEDGTKSFWTNEFDEEAYKKSKKLVAKQEEDLRAIMRRTTWRGEQSFSSWLKKLNAASLDALSY